MTLRTEAAKLDTMLQQAVGATFRSVIKLTGTVAWGAPQSLPNDGKIIADERG